MSAVLYENPSLTIFIIDIPTSIALAQNIPRRFSSKSTAGEEPPKNEAPIKDTLSTQGRALLSSPPLLNPYPGQPEPKTERARARVLKQTHESELAFYRIACPLVASALEDIREKYSGDWCLQRQILNDELSSETSQGNSGSGNSFEGGDSPGPRRDSASNRPLLFGGGEPELRNPTVSSGHGFEAGEPPLILSPSINHFSSFSEIRDTLVKNTSSFPAIIQITPTQKAHITRDSKRRRTYSRDKTKVSNTQNAYHFPTTRISFTIPPNSSFILSSIPEALHNTHSQTSTLTFNFILLDPPWPNRSVKRSAHYVPEVTLPFLGSLIGNIIKSYLNPKSGIVGIWVTNSAAVKSTAREAMRDAGLEPFEEWVWVKTTMRGETVFPLDGLWRKPFEVLILGKRRGKGEGGEGVRYYEPEIKRKVIAAVPDVHSRKPNLKELIGKIFFSTPAPGTEDEASEGDIGEHKVQEYSGLEVFARNLTAGWTSFGDEVLRFNWDGWWV
ncbi:hypothetical protein FQN54_008523 [Arachnomyces sp. PD_36]|nr:hypothetical protein FQN54_008523 [Arachnomyces sp. PD_36]